MTSEEPILFNADDDLPSRSDAIQNRADILRISRELFAEHGIENVSMSQIAREANIGKGTLYRHFRNKADLCHALLDDDQRLLQETSLAYMRENDSDPLEKLGWFIEAVSDFTRRNLDLLYEASITRITAGTDMLEHPAHHWQWMTIVGLLRQINPSVDVEYFADVIYMMLDPGTYRFQHYVRGYEHDRIIEGILSLLDQISA